MLLPLAFVYHWERRPEVLGPARPFKEGWLLLLPSLSASQVVMEIPVCSPGLFIEPAFSSEMLTLVSVTHSLPSVAPDKPDAEAISSLISQKLPKPESPREAPVTIQTSGFPRCLSFHLLSGLWAFKEMNEIRLGGRGRSLST